MLRALDPSTLLERRNIQGHDVDILTAIFHVTEHFSTHTGQIILLTKLLTATDLGFYDFEAGAPVERWRSRPYRYAGAGPKWLAGSTLGYRKSLWTRHKFPEIQIGEDSRFVRAGAVLNPDGWERIARPHMFPAAMQASYTSADLDAR